MIRCCLAHRCMEPWIRKQEAATDFNGRVPSYPTASQQDVPLFRASSHCQYEWREKLVNEILSRVQHHSFGQCSNNMNNTDELSLYPECKSP